MKPDERHHFPQVWIFQHSDSSQSVASQLFLSAPTSKNVIYFKGDLCRPSQINEYFSLNRHISQQPAWPSPLRNIDKNMILMLTTLRNSQGVFGALWKGIFLFLPDWPPAWRMSRERTEGWRNGLPGKTKLFLLSWSQRRV